MNTITVDHLSLEFSTQELWLLFSLFGPAVILGVKNPYLGWLMDEREEAQKDALLMLVDRDLVRVVSEDEIAVDDVLTQMVDTCVSPRHTLILQTQGADASENGRQRFIHYGSHMIVEHATLSAQQHHLTAIKDNSVLIDYITPLLRLDTLAQSKGKRFQVEEKILFEARKLCENKSDQEALSLLLESGLDDKVASALVSTLNGPVSNSAAVVVVNRVERNTQHVRGMAILEGERDVWIIRPYDRNGSAYVEFTPANAEILKRRLIAILP